MLFEVYYAIRTIFGTKYIKLVFYSGIVSACDLITTATPQHMHKRKGKTQSIAYSYYKYKIKIKYEAKRGTSKIKLEIMHNQLKI